MGREMLGKLEEWFVVVCLSLMAVLAFYQVITRYVFTSLGLPWIEELVRHLFVAITYIGAAVVMRKKGHQGVEFLSQKLPARMKPYHQVYVAICSLAFAIIASYAALQLVSKQRVLPILTTGTRIPIYIPTIPIVVGFLLITYYLIRDLIAGLRSLCCGKAGEQE